MLLSGMLPGKVINADTGEMQPDKFPAYAFPVSQNTVLVSVPDRLWSAARRAGLLHLFSFF